MMRASPVGSDFPRLFGRYRLQTLLAKGGRSLVYLAQDTALNRSVAVKVFPGAVAPSRMPEFFREARAAARLKHPNIITVHDLGEMNGQVFLAMDHLVGETLARMVAKEIGRAHV